MSAWTCEKCGWEGRTTQKSGHITYRCQKQGRLKKALEKQARIAERDAAAAAEAERQKAIAEVPPPPPTFFQYLACVCRCGTQIGQVKGQKKRQFVNHDHYDVWRRNALKKAAGGDVDLVEERKRAEEVAAVAAKDDAIRREAEAVRLLSPRASFLLWARCLEFDPGDVSGIPA